MKFLDTRPFANPEAAARKLMEIANSIEPVQDGRIHIELINWPFLHELRGSPAKYKTGLDLAIERGWLWIHESGTYMKMTQTASFTPFNSARLVTDAIRIMLVQHCLFEFLWAVVAAVEPLAPSA